MRLPRSIEIDITIRRYGWRDPAPQAMKENEPLELLETSSRYGLSFKEAFEELLERIPQ